MKIVYHERFLTPYPTASVENPQRLSSIFQEVQNYGEIVTPAPAQADDLLLVHTPRLLRSMANQADVHEVALLAVGGAIQTATLALVGEPAFGLLRPPGHHAGPDSHWGFCFYNNMAIAIEWLRRQGRIRRALILDIDLHFGDGTDRIFADNPDVEVVNIEATNREQFLAAVQNTLHVSRQLDIIGVSAGFDTYVKDWGGLLQTDDYRLSGAWVKETALRDCQGRRFGLLEGGYYLPDLGKNCLAFLTGLA
ncbi:MAG: histone deacetylase family protein [Desulfobacca sp.]|uniref:histone deacetylase family protein n=1 Tax=Desulfobacca sp. TaxID=2067990 RepID=UPI004049AE81